jgi:hypothetical protein
MPKSYFIPITPGDTPLTHLAAKTEQGAWDKLMREASHMPYQGRAGFEERGYTVEEWEGYKP